MVSRSGDSRPQSRKIRPCRRDPTSQRVFHVENPDKTYLLLGGEEGLLVGSLELATSSVLLEMFRD